MSKIGKKPIQIPSEVEVKFKSDLLEVKGPKGSLTLKIHEKSKLKINENEIIILKHNEKDKTKLCSSCWGLTRSLVQNMIIGVTNGYEKKLELQGVGYRMQMQGNKLVLALGFSHPVEIEIPQNLTVKIEDNNILNISGIDKQLVGQFAAVVRKLKEVEPYKGKGFRYVGEIVRRKSGKKAAAGK